MSLIPCFAVSSLTVTMSTSHVNDFPLAVAVEWLLLLLPLAFATLQQSHLHFPFYSFQCVLLLRGSISSLLFEPSWFPRIGSTTQKMTEIHRDAFDSLDHDVMANIFRRLDDPGDIMRLSSVSHSLQDFIISSALSRQLCLRMFPQLSSISRTVNLGNAVEDDRGHAARDHRIYASLVRDLIAYDPAVCTSRAICASSTDNYPYEAIRNTLDPGDRMGRWGSYWSSTGQSNPSVPERLTYELVSDLCVVSEINIQPFQAFFQASSPIYSARAVRFHMGHKLPVDSDVLLLNDKSVKDRVVWTYTSPEFPMIQENTLQHFKLPRPVLCIGGILQVELLGRVQIQVEDCKFYFCIAHVEALGKSLRPIFGAKIIEPSGRFELLYDPHAVLPSPPLGEDSGGEESAGEN